MRHIILLLLILSYLSSNSQNIIVQKIKMKNLSYIENVSYIPKLKDEKNPKNIVVEKINKQILEFFYINSFQQNEVEEFRWYDVIFSHEIKQNILCLMIEGEWGGGPYPSYLDADIYFDLQTGEMLQMPTIPFQSLFTLSGYMDFLQKYWLKGVKKEFIDIEKCAEMKPYCSYYDIIIDSASKKKLYVSLVFPCFPHVAEACSPEFSITLEINSISQYLNDVGKYILLESNYFSKTHVEKYLENKKLKNKLQENIFIFGKIDNKYPFSLAINVAKDGIVKGFYFYDSKMQNISLLGEKIDNTIFLTETIENKQTGFFEFKYWNTLYRNLKNEFALYDEKEELIYLTGFWTNSEKTKQLPIIIYEIKTSNSH